MRRGVGYVRPALARRVGVGVVLVSLAAVAVPRPSWGATDDPFWRDVRNVFPWWRDEAPTAAPDGLDAGHYVGRLGLHHGAPELGTQDVKLDVEPYSASYLPAKKGQLAKEVDCNYLPEILNGFDSGQCDMFNETVKASACMSAAEKLDRAAIAARGVDLGLVDDYLKRGYRPDAESWEGFCHNWAPAALDPVAGLVTNVSMVYGGVAFGVGDLRELVNFTYPSPDATFIGTRNYGSKPDEKVFDAVDLHNIFTEYIGPGKPGVVMDVEPGTEVWNQPFYRYKMDTTDATDAEAVRDKIPEGGRAVHVDLRAWYAVEGQYRYEGSVYSRTLDWSYYLVMDDSDRVVGGAWDEAAGNSKIPDFAWVPNRKDSNKYFDFIQEIAKKGVPVLEVETFCNAVNEAAKDGHIDDDERGDLQKLSAKLAGVTDPNGLDNYMRETALAYNVDYSELSDIMVA